VKMIYIDPPYNTGKDFIYRDNFKEPLMDYLEKTGQIDTEGSKLTTNTEASGRYHSDWLNFMYPRLFLTRSLLRDDGVILVSIDDHEVHNLRKIMDEIFGEENFVANIVWQHSVQPKGYLEKFSMHHNYLLCYQKSDLFTLESLERTEEHNKNYSNPDNDPNGPWRSGDVRNALYRPNLIFDIITPSGKVIKPSKNGWRWSKETINKKIEDGEIIFNEDETRIIRKIFLKNVQGRAPETIWFGKEVGTTREAVQELKELFDGWTPFETPKPSRLVKRMLEITTEKQSDDLVLDFFAGSGTTGHAVWNLNKEDGGKRKFILINLDEEVLDENIKKDFPTVADICIERLKRVSEEYKKEEQQKLTENDQDFGFKVFRLDKSNFNLKDEFGISEEEDVEELKKKYLEWLGLWVNEPLVGEWKPIDIVYETMLKEGFDLNSKIEERKIKGKKFFHVTDEKQELEF
ncbi:MAG: site-specific DNA-methyltransferase, partial [Methanophagales archaeon]|nr:site-specific DNA-methyltransferase [Methanophagales archaeon]